ncbi:MAG: DsrE family protein [Bacteroidota bacterium]
MYRFQFLFVLIFTAISLNAQEARVSPAVPGFGAIFPLEVATVKPDPSLRYKIVVDVYSGAEEPTELAFGLNNVARMLNLHAVGGVPTDSMDVVIAIHGGATFATLNNDAFREKYEVDNPNIGLIRALKKAGVKLVVCGQSLMSREIPLTNIQPEIEVATSMLTTVSMYQLKGYAVFRF